MNVSVLVTVESGGVFFPLVNFNLDLPDKQDLFVLMLLMFMWVLMKALLCLRWPAWAATLKVA